MPVIFTIGFWEQKNMKNSQIRVSTDQWQNNSVAVYSNNCTTKHSINNSNMLKIIKTKENKLSTKLFTPNIWNMHLLPAPVLY